jgi:hypothetical protein
MLKLPFSRTQCLASQCTKRQGSSAVCSCWTAMLRQLEGKHHRRCKLVCLHVWSEQNRSTGYANQMLANKTIPNEVTAPSRPKVLCTMTCQMQPHCCRCYHRDDAGSRAMQMPINNGELPKPWVSLTQPSLNCCRAPAARPTYPTLPTTNYLHAM